MAQPGEESMTLPTATMCIFILVLTMVSSLTGNSFVCMAFYRNRRLRTITNFFVLSLAVADIMGTIFVFPFATISIGLGKWPFKFNFCQFSGFFTFLWAQMSLNILALTAVNRYFCVIKPNLYPVLFTRKKTLVFIFCVFLLTFTVLLTGILAIPIFFKWHPVFLFCSWSADEINNELSITLAGSVIFTMSLTFFCYASVYRTIRRHNSAVSPSLQNTTGQVTVSAHEIQASRVLIAAVIGFFVCWIPSATVRILQNWAHLSLPSFLLSFSTLSVFVSSWTSPVIYGVMNRAMRKEFIKILHRKNKS